MLVDTITYYGDTFLFFLAKAIVDLAMLASQLRFVEIARNSSFSSQVYFMPIFV